jgi:hypothetical protein
VIAMQKQRQTKVHDGDLAVLNWMCEQYAARLDHLEALAGKGETWSRNVVARLRDAGLVRMEQIVVGQPSWVIPTYKGLRACGLRYWIWKPKLGALTHISATNDVRIHVQAQKPGSEWMSERQLLAEAKEKGKGRHGHVPDGVLLVEGHSVAIEVELSAKHIRRTEGIIDELAGRFDGILYYCGRWPYRRLKPLEESGRWPKLGVRELPRETGLEWL